MLALELRVPRGYGTGTLRGPWGGARPLVINLCEFDLHIAHVYNARAHSRYWSFLPPVDSFFPAIYACL